MEILNNETSREKPEMCKGCLFEERDINSGVCAMCAVSYCVRNGLDPESRIVKE